MEGRQTSLFPLGPVLIIRYKIENVFVGGRSEVSSSVLISQMSSPRINFPFFAHEQHIVKNFQILQVLSLQFTQHTLVPVMLRK